jgi:superfamily II helicase
LQKNICQKCENEHSKHEIKSYELMSPNEVELQELKESLNKIDKMFSNLKISIDNI